MDHDEWIEKITDEIMMAKNAPEVQAAGRESYDETKPTIAQKIKLKKLGLEYTDTDQCITALYEGQNLLYKKTILTIDEQKQLYHILGNASRFVDFTRIEDPYNPRLECVPVRAFSYASRNAA
jgi:hypothetical protein